MSTANSTSEHSRCRGMVRVDSGQPLASALMFSASVLGNVSALVLLEVRRRGTGSSLYRVLAFSLVLTDLLGSVAVSPVALVAYARRRTLVGMGEGRELCSYFGFSLTLLSLSTLAILCVMALERYLSVGHPYFYERHLSERRGYVTVGVVFTGSLVFSLGPFVGLADYVQYCPGTWCFLEMSYTRGQDRLYIGFYASLILVMILTTVACNIRVIYLLVVMHKRGRFLRRAPSVRRRCVSMTEEMEHLLPLAIITVVFICCTCPLAIQVYLNMTGRREEQHSADLGALRLLSTHSIINPWVFIILRPSVLRIIWRKLHKQKSKRPPSSGGMSKETGNRPQWASPEAPLDQSQGSRSAPTVRELSAGGHCEVT
ncbi:prostaglandin E2 receptor EP2 subtype-like [Betta splendens]|uniref:Prostaglandin E2 receptor EP2 subtype-like n=1 Tax=Betta splendens TaxID=158456 RepID=A0A6P7LSN9_BETSP|nr:prostaglandin E2 receptor EP2 subtype-like [Betta splendens]